MHPLVFSVTASSVRRFRCLTAPDLGSEIVRAPSRHAGRAATMVPTVVVEVRRATVINLQSRRSVGCPWSDSWAESRSEDLGWDDARDTLDKMTFETNTSRPRPREITRSARRVLAGSALALLMPASLLFATDAGSAAGPPASSAAASSSERQATRSRASLQVLPQIVQQGRRTASPDAARVAITATIKPRRAGRPVRLQVERGAGWKNVGKSRTDRRGRAEFSARALRRGEALAYRVKSGSYQGLRRAVSRPQSTARWLTPRFTETFSGRSLGPEWSHRGQSYEKESLRRCSKGSPKAVKVSGGKVRLSVIEDKSRAGKCKAIKRGKVSGRYAYRLNGHISTQNKMSFKYGFAAARVKMHKRRGQHSSFWLQPQTSRAGTPRTAGAEIDVIEYFGDKHPRGGLTSFIHWKKNDRLIKTGSWLKQPRSFLKNRRDGWSKNYHVFSVEWTPKMYIFRIDGQETWRTRKGVSGQPQYPILSLLASDYELSLMKDKQLPQHMQVDWLRIWQA